MLIYSLLDIKEKLKCTIGLIKISMNCKYSDYTRPVLPVNGCYTPIFKLFLLVLSPLFSFLSSPPPHLCSSLLSPLISFLSIAWVPRGNTYLCVIAFQDYTQLFLQQNRYKWFLIKCIVDKRRLDILLKLPVQLVSAI